MTKPLKTVEEWFEAYMPKGTVKPNKKIDAEKAELMTLIMANWRKRAKADLYQLMLSLVETLKPDTYLLGCSKHWSDDSSGTCTCDENERIATQFYNKAKDELRQKLSEHFNVEESK